MFGTNFPVDYEYGWFKKKIWEYIEIAFNLSLNLSEGCIILEGQPLFKIFMGS